MRSAAVATQVSSSNLGPAASRPQAPQWAALARPHLEQLSEALRPAPHAVVLTGAAAVIIDALVEPAQEPALAYLHPGVPMPTVLPLGAPWSIDSAAIIGGSGQQVGRLHAVHRGAAAAALLRHSAGLLSRSLRSEPSLRRDYHDMISQISRFTAHSLGNPLAGLGLTIDLLASNPTSANGPRYLERCVRVMERLTEFKENLAALGGSSRQDLHEVEVPLLVEQVLDTQRLDGAYQTTVKLDKKLPTVRCHRGLLVHAMSVLVRNAIDAMPEGGVLGIEVAPHQGAPRITVWDQGPGLPAGFADKIFRAPVSTRQHGGGLGLLMVSMIMEQIHGGAVAYAPHPPTGCRFHLDLPLPRAVVASQVQH